MDWIQVMTIVGGNFGLFLWIRQETRADARIFENEMRKWKDDINARMNDFQNHLYAIQQNKT